MTRIARGNLGAAVLLAAVVLTVPLSLAAQSGVPELSEEVVIGLHPFNGRDYLQATFSHGSGETVYLTADSDNFLRVLKTLVYYWPLTDEWRTDTETLNVTFQGTLVFSDTRGETFRRVAPTAYTYFSVPGRYEGEVAWHVLTGQEAADEIGSLRSLVDQYSLEQQQRLRVAQELQDRFNALLPEISRRRRAGEDIAPIVAEAEAIDSQIREMRTPPRPPWEEMYVTPPQRVETGYVVNLPEGRYRMHFEDDDGRVLEGSQKEVVVFAPLRRNTIGYQILPGDSYTLPVDSTEPGSVIFIDGTSEFYLRAYLQVEFNDLYYARMVDQSGRGNPNVRRWVRIRELSDPELRIESGSGGSDTVLPLDYRVRQTPGATLGYTILPLDADARNSGEVPSFRAVRLDPEEIGTAAQIEILSTGDADSGARSVRLVRVPPSVIPLLLIALLPWGVYVASLVKRRRYIRRLSHLHGEEPT